ncbi:MAG: HIT domain-containing protein [Ignavibacteria bacterium]|nr:HIT domain-containing protein [Ignavibacteria bacterium]
MDNLWSPWRSQYINSFGDSEPEGCFLCAGALHTHEDTERLIVARLKTCYVVMNRYPYNSGHLLVAPYRHIGELPMLTVDERNDLMDTINIASEVLTLVYKPHGINIGANIGRAAGAGVPGHIHFHLVPRWNGDTNFMPLFAEVKVISESMEEAYRQLQQAFKKY